jgi:rhodanese-related sulfurtransferase
LIESKADIVVVDNQPKGAYDMEHIPGAVNFPWAMQIKLPINLPRNKMLILYCACSHEEDSTDVANQLMEFGYHNVKLLEGGWLRWVELGYPIEKK